MEAAVRVVVDSARHREKDVGSLSLSTMSGLQMTWGHEVLGYIPSPHGERVVIVVREIRRGWEGLPAVEVIHLMGASLEQGF